MWPGSLPSDDFVRSTYLIKVVDGDTLRLEIDLGWSAYLIHDIRLSGCQTPENRGYESAAGLWVTQQVKDWIGDVRDVLIQSRDFKVGKYGRCVCYVWIGGRQLNSWLLDQGYAWPTDKNGKVLGDRNVEGLSLPEGIKQVVREALT